MDTNKLIQGIVTVVVAYLAIQNSSSLMTAVIYYLVGSTIVGIVLNKVLGTPSGGMDVFSLTGLGLITYMFYKQYGLAGVALSAGAPFLAATVLSMLSKAGLNL